MLRKLFLVNIRVFLSILVVFCIALMIKETRVSYNMIDGPLVLNTDVTSGVELS